MKINRWFLVSLILIVLYVRAEWVTNLWIERANVLEERIAQIEAGEKKSQDSYCYFAGGWGYFNGYWYDQAMTCLLNDHRNYCEFGGLR